MEGHGHGADGRRHPLAVRQRRARDLMIHSATSTLISHDKLHALGQHQHEVNSKIQPEGPSAMAAHGCRMLPALS
jgi:hypothetical protein